MKTYERIAWACVDFLERHGDAICMVLISLASIYFAVHILYAGFTGAFSRYIP